MPDMEIYRTSSAIFNRILSNVNLDLNCNYQLQPVSNVSNSERYLSKLIIARLSLIWNLIVQYYFWEKCIDYLCMFPNIILSSTTIVKPSQNFEKKSEYWTSYRANCKTNISRKYLFEHIKRLQCYELTKRFSHLLYMLPSPLTYAVCPWSMHCKCTLIQK